MNIRMNMQPKNERMINDTMESLDRLPQVQIPDQLRRRLLNIPKEVVILDQRIPMRAVWMAVAGLLLLVVLNIASVKRYKTDQRSEDTTIYTEYFSYLDEL